MLAAAPGNTLRGLAILGAATPVALGLLYWIWKRARRPTANRKSHAALMILFGGGLTFGWLAVALNSLPGSAEKVACWIGAVILLTIGAAAVTAVWGLVEVITGGGKYKEGLGPSITTLLLLAGWFGVGIFMAMLEVARGKPSAADAPSPPAATAPRATAPPVDHVFKELNFAFRGPPSPWVHLREKTFNQDSTLEYLRSNPSVYLQLIGEGEESGLQDLKSLESFYEAAMRSRVKEVEIVDRAPLTLSGVEGVSLDIKAKANRLEVRYKVWLGARNGFVWQMVIWGEEKIAGRLDREAADLRAGFRVLDPERRAAALVPAEAAVSARFGWRVAPPDGWGRLDRLDSEVPFAEWGAEIGPSMRLAVVAVATLGLEPPLEGAGSALLSMLGHTLPPPDAAVKRWTEKGLERLAFTREQRVGERDWRYRFRVLRGPGAAWAVAAWGPKDTASEDALERALEAVTVEGPGEAREVKELSPRERRIHARFFNQVGIWHHEGSDPRRAAVAFRLALEIVPADAVVSVNAVRALRQSGQSAEALALADANLGDAPAAGPLRAERASILLEAGRRAEAMKAYADLFAAAYDDDEAFAEYVEALEADDPKGALRELDAALARRDRSRTVALKAGVLTRQGRADEAVAALKARVDGALFDVEAAHALLDVYEIAERHSEQAAWAEAMIARGADSARAWASRGRAEMELRWHRKAKASFERALEKAPGDAGLKESIAEVSALLGEGSNTEIKAPLAPVPLPLDDAAPPDPEALRPWTSHDAVVTRYGVAAEGWGSRARKTVYLRVRVLTFRGVERFSALTFDFQPLAERVHVNRLEVRDAEGRLVARGDPSEAYVLDAPSGGVPSSSRTLHIPVTGLKPGTDLDLIMTREDRADAPRGAMESLTFYWDLPCLRMAFFARGNIRASASGGLEAREVEGGRLWSAGPLKPHPPEPLQTDPARFVPAVWIGPAEATWASEGRAYLEDVREFLEPDEALAAAAAERVKGVEGERARAVALAEFVQKEVAYHAVAFGRRGRRPQRAGEVLRRKLGDCKDQALLLHLLLRSAGVPSSLALVRAGGDVRTDVPSLDAFDHMIVRVPALGFVDPTQKDIDVALGVPQGLGGGAALILEPDVPRLDRIPEAPPGASAVEGARVVTVRATGDVLVKETLTFKGYAAADLRGQLRAARPEARSLTLRHRLGHADVEIVGFEADGLEATGRPLWLRIEYRIPRVFQDVEGRRIGRLPALWERDALALPPSDARTTPFRLREMTAWKMSVEARMDGEGELTVEGRPSAGEKGPFAEWGVEAPDRATLRYALAIREGERKAADYGACREAIERALAAVERPVVVKLR